MIPLEELQLKAEKGDARAQLDLALAYQKPFGQDYALAFEWLCRSAYQGLDEAQYRLGLMFQFGTGIPPDFAAAVEWLGKAADQGHLPAANQLGWIYSTGRGIEKSRAETIKWFRKAADRGDKAAQYNLGNLYAHGEGAEKDETEAVKWYRLAAGQGHEVAQYTLGGMYAEGRGVAKDEEAAVEWFRKAAAQGYYPARANLNRWPRPAAAITAKTNSEHPAQDLSTVLKASKLRTLGIHGVDISNLRIRLIVRIAGGSHPHSGIFEIVCDNAVDYAIRPTNPAIMEGGPAIEFHEQHPLLQDPHFHLIPGGDGEVFRPPLDLKLLILDQSRVIAERFEIRPWDGNRARPL